MTKNKLRRLLMVSVLSMSVLGCSFDNASGVSAVQVAADKRGTLAAGCSSDKGVEQFLATYQVFAVEKYGGGLTSEAIAKNRIGQSVLLTPGKFEVRNVTISQPDYRISCHAVPPEGEVQEERWSNFYGFGTERKAVEVLDVYDPAEHSSDPDVRFEIVQGKNGRELWEMYDGWLYRMKVESR